MPVTPDLLLREFATPEHVPEYRFIAGSDRLVTTGADGHLRVVDARDGKAVDVGPGRSPQPSPDGRWILFLAPDEGETRVWVCRVDGGERRVLCRSAGTVEAAAWSPDSLRIACAVRLRDVSAKEASDDRVRPFAATLPRTRLEVVGLDGRAADALVEQRGQIAPMAWTADGEALVYRLQGTQNFHARGGIWAEVRELDLRRRAVTVVHRGAGQHQFAVSSSGRFVAFLGDRSPVYEPTSPYLAIYDRARRHIDEVTPPSFQGFPLPQMTWMPADRGLLFTAQVRAGQRLLDVRRVAGRTISWSRPAMLPAHGVWISSPRLSADGREVVFVGLDLQGGQTLMRSDPAMRAPRRIRRLTPRIDALEHGDAREIEWTSRDGLRLGGVLVKPPHFDPRRRYPLVVDLHGGPEPGLDRSGAILCSSAVEWQMWAARGYLVLAADYRRSMAYGWDVFRRSWQRQDYFDRDYDDIMSGIDHVVATAGADRRRIALIGHSWGGAEVLNAITRSGLFRAAIACEGRADDYSRYGTSFGVGGDCAADYQYRGKPWEVPWNYFRNSAAWRVRGVTTPTLLVITDPSAFASDNEFMYTALLRQHVDTQLVRYKGENHLVMQPVHQRDLLMRAVRWVDDHLRAGDRQSRH